jgi:NADPH:quinone reductase-like Zn-dependent oxidoreductase
MAPVPQTPLIIRTKAMSQTIKFAKAGGPEVLDYVEVAAINPGSNEVRVKVKAIGLNRAESMWRLDDYIEPVARFPAVLGYEAAGTIDALGEGVTGFAVGDAVNVIPSFSMSQYGTYGEVVIVPLHAVVKQPTSLSFTEAASIWMMFVTAYGALIEDAKVGKDDFVFDPGRLEQRRLGRDPARQLCRSDADRADPHLGEETAASRCGRRACHRDFRD